MAQGTRVSGNLFHDNINQDLFTEVNHGPFVVDNNLFLSPSTTLLINSQGGAFAHNLFMGGIIAPPIDERQTPFHKPHSTEVAGYHNNPIGDTRYFNNLFVKNADLTPYDQSRLPVWIDGNVFFAGAKPSKNEANPLVKREIQPNVKLVEKSDGMYLELSLDNAWSNGRRRKLVTTELLGTAAIPKAPYETRDGAPIRIDVDYFGKPRNVSNPAPGPFENPGEGPVTLKVWPK
jgi:alpha-N-arabinofuranosidase